MKANISSYKLQRKLKRPLQKRDRTIFSEHLVSMYVVENYPRNYVDKIVFMEKNRCPFNKTTVIWILPLFMKGKESHKLKDL